MSFEAAAWAIKQKTKTATEKLVLITLADCQNAETNLCYPSIPYIAEHSLCSDRQAKRCIQSLEDQGLISVQRETGKSNHYSLNLQGGDKMSPVTSGEKTSDIQGKTSDTHVPRLVTPMSPKPVNNQEIKPVSKTKKKTKIPDDFELTPERGLRAKKYWESKQRPDLVARGFEIWGQFINHHKQHGNTMADWDCAWQTWYTNAVKFEKPPRQQTHKPSEGDFINRATDKSWADGL